MSTRRSVPSVYSTASRLLSPCSTDSTTSFSRQPSEAASSRAGTPLPPSNNLSTSAYPFSGLSDDVPPAPGEWSRYSSLRQAALPGSHHPDHEQDRPDRTAHRLEGHPHGREASIVVSTPLSYSVKPSLSHSPSVTAGEYRRLSTSRLQQHNQLYDQTASLYSPQETPGRYAESARASHFRFHAQGQDGLGLTQDSLDEVIMAIDMKRDGKIGAAYYDAMDETLVLEEDIPMGGIEAVETLLLRVQPTSIIIPNRAPTELVEFLERDAHRSNDNESGYGSQGAYILRNIASSQFDYDTSKDMLASLDIGPSKPDPVVIIGTNEESATSISSSKHHRLMRLAEKVNLDSCLAVGCAGALLNELERRQIAENPSPEGESDVAFRVRSVEMNTERMTLLLNADAMMSLQIVQSELHPNPQTRASNRSEPTAKETLSITGLLQALASSAQGKKTLRKMLLRPTTDIRLINERHKCIEVFLHSENRETANNMRKLLRKLKSTNTLLRHVSKGVDRIRGQLSVRIEDWKAVLRFAMAATQLKQAVQTLRGAENIPFLARIRTEIEVERFLHIGDCIMRTIDFQLSRETGITEILPGASEYLDGLKHELSEVYRFLPELAEHVARDVPQEFASYIRHCTVMADLGFLVAVQRDPETGEGTYYGQYHPEGEWTLFLVTGDIAYYKNQAMRDLDSQYGDLLGRIVDEEIEVMMALAAAVLQHEQAVMHAGELFGELDSLLALALAAEKYNWTAPTMTKDNIIDIADGRHPLQELLVPSFIPNDCVIAGGPGRGNAEHKIRDKAAPSMLILTGPNNSGKSIYMRQVALIVYLAHTGSYVPAAHATIGITDRILTRIATRETVVNDESAFLVDLKQAAFALNFGTRRSLFLIDEFGKGTIAETGCALFASYLHELMFYGANRPKVIAGTHFHEVFEHSLIKPSNEVAFAHMDVHLDLDAKDPEDRITFLYRLVPGRGPSLGIMLAAAMDIPTRVVERAKHICALLGRNESLIDVLAVPSEEEEKELKRAELIARRFLALEIPDPKSKEAENIREMIRDVLDVRDEDLEGE